MNFSAWSIRNPVPAILLFVVLGFLGIIGFRGLKIQNFPDIELPTIIISATLEGAAPAQLETEVARKIEDKLASLGGIQHTRTTITDGSAQIVVEFDIDKNTEEALNEVRNAVDSVRSELPVEMPSPIISKVTTSGAPIITFYVQSNQLDELRLSWFVDNEISKALLSVKGVGKLSRVGGVDREIRVELDPVRMAGLGVSAQDVSTRLKQVRQDASGGRGDIGSTIQSVRTLSAAHTLSELSNLDIPLSDGRRIRLDQVGTIRDTAAERTTYAFLDGKPVVGFEITRIKGASEVSVIKAVREAVTTLSSTYKNVTIAEAFNSVDPVEDNYHGSMHLLFEGAILAVIVVWWFLRDWRATFVSAAALPLSIIPTFAIMYFANFSLNVLTLLSLALVIGILVDDAIVEIENIVRHLRMGKTPVQAATEAADEIGLAVIATTFALVAVFLPTAFMGGVPGKFFKQFGMTAAVAIMASLIVARLLTPMMAAYCLKSSIKSSSTSLAESSSDSHLVEKDGPLMTRYLGWVKNCLTHRKTTVALSVVFFIASLAIVPLLPTGFVPAADTSQTRVSIELQPGSTLNDTRTVTEEARKILRAMPDVTHVFSTIGVAGGISSPFGGGGGNDVRKASLTVNLVHRSKRSYKQSEIEGRIREKLKALAGARITVGLGGSGEKLQVTLASDDFTALQEASRRVERDLRQLKGVGNITSGASVQRPEIQITPDFTKAAELGITSQAVANVIRIATSGDFSMNLPKLNLPQRQIPIRIRLEEAVRYDLDLIRQLRIPGRNTNATLSSFSEVELGSGPTQINRLDRKQTVSIDVELGKRIIGDVVKDVAKLPALKALPANVKEVPTGDLERMAELFGSFGTAMAIGILCIYVVLVLLFHDFLQPVTILTAIPLSVGGAFFALLITHNSFSMPSIIGLLMLMGVVTKNSILLVEYAIVARREHHLSRFDALIDACHKRSTPILMTTIAMGVGMLPIAMGIGADPSFRAPMAIAVIGGLITSTLLSLLVIPVVFTYIDDLMDCIKHLLKKRQEQ